MQDLKIKLKSASRLALLYTARVFLCVYTLCVIVLGASDYFIPDSITVSGVTDGIHENADNGKFTTVKLLGTLPVKNVKLDVVPDVRLIPCGNVFGVKFFTKGVLVINLSDIQTKSGTLSPAKQAGLKVGDIITSVDGQSINTVEELAKCVEQSKGNKMTVKYTRDGKEMSGELNAQLSLSDKQYKTGIWVRDSTAGIGTMTFYNPQNGTFAGLGHGICDVDTGKIMPLLRGTVVDVEITDIIKGRRGSPGELKGSFASQKLGTLMANSNKGVFGVMDKKPECAENQALEVGFSHEVHEGEAYIYSELDNTSGINKYSVNISSIDRSSENGKNFVVEITDKKLLEKTGGIVQGMSGSPIIQDGKLVGAVTHVLVNDPARGYGLFIENMLRDVPELLQ